MEEVINRIFDISKQDKKTLTQKLCKGTEELGELAQAILSYVNAHGCGYKNKTKEDVIEEASDVITIAFSIISLVEDHNVDQEKLKEIFNGKLDKWVEKINE